LCAVGLLLCGCEPHPKTLKELIELEQQHYVRESFGEERYECFTNDDLDEFKRDKVTDAIVNRLKDSKDFARIILELKAKPEGEQRSLLLAARRTYQPTWSQLGRISPEGQTFAGQEAQGLISSAIADLAEQKLSSPVEELRKAAEQ
jgi:hypothetical protein